MGLKEEVMEALFTGNAQRLERLAASQPRSARYLLGRLWDPDESIRSRAAVGLGITAAAHPELGVELLRRLVWALNDESATHGVYALAAIGEIGYRCPSLVAPFVGPVASFAWDDSLRSEILRALARIADAAPDLVRPHVAAVRRYVSEGDSGDHDLIERLEATVRGQHDHL